MGVPLTHEQMHQQLVEWHRFHEDMILPGHNARLDEMTEAFKEMRWVKRELKRLRSCPTKEG